jgi:hypothetical protein
MAAGCIAMAAYLAACQFLVARYGFGGETEDSLSGWASPIAMVAPVIAIFLFMAAAEAPGVVLAQGIPMVAAACAGILAGALAARRRAAPAPARAAKSGRLARRMLLQAGASRLLAVAAALALVVAPAAAKDVSKDAMPHRAVNGLAVCVAVQALLAVLMLWKTRTGKTPVAAGVFSPILGLLYLAMASDFLAHGPGMRGAAIALFACGGMDFAVCVLAVAAILQRTDPAETQAAPAR